MSLSKIYDPSAVEQKWYNHWLENKFFQSKPDLRNPEHPDYQEPFTVVMPPPNVTGILHMGHMLNNTIQDMLVRRARMEGKNACWVPGTDHASIATEAKLVALLKESGRTKQEIGREKYLEMAFEWKEKYGGIILEQLKKLGASCDWDRTRFTMDPDLSEGVIQQFIRLYREGLIYRGARMINWDPAGKTAVSDEEVIYKPVNSSLHYLKYQLTEDDNFIIVATTRPETIFADVAICVHPDDSRYKGLHGKKVWIPLTRREIPIITDEYVSMDFGTGCLKITPAHSLADYEIGMKHGLPILDSLTEEGKLNSIAGPYEGLDRFEGRKKVVIDLQVGNLIDKTENYVSQIGFSERTDSIIEPRISTQWFLKMEELAEPALKAFINAEQKPSISLIPEKYLNTYRHWMENIHDWCISRQLWWGHRIPAWYNENQELVVAKTEEEAHNEFEKSGLHHQKIRQDEDVLDTWFSSWLWPITVFDGIKDPDNPDFKYYYPTNDLVTAPEILFFWVARMVMIGMDLTGKVPFKKVYLTGIVRDKQGRKMSKSLGNSPNPLDLISQYGADAIRMGLLMSSPAGNDLLYDESLIHQGRNFANKIWNAYRLLESWEERLSDPKLDLSSADQLAMGWFSNQLNITSALTPSLYSEYRLSELLVVLYKLTWDDFCGWYLEMIKPSEGAFLHPITYQQTIAFFRVLLMQLHPIMPFITEELWSVLPDFNLVDSRKNQRTEKSKSILFARVDQFKNWLHDSELKGDLSTNVWAIRTEKVFMPSITEIRNLRNTYKIGMKQGLKLVYLAENNLDGYPSLYQKLGGIQNFERVFDKPEKTVAFSISGYEFFLFIEDKLDKEVEKFRILEEIKYQTGFLASVKVKLNNEKFMANARQEVKDLEMKKRESAEEKIRLLNESLQALFD